MATAVIAVVTGLRGAASLCCRWAAQSETDFRVLCWLAPIDVQSSRRQHRDHFLELMMSKRFPPTFNGPLARILACTTSQGTYFPFAPAPQNGDLSYHCEKVKRHAHRFNADGMFFFFFRRAVFCALSFPRAVGLAHRELCGER